MPELQENKDKAIMENPCDKEYEHSNIPPYTWHPSVGNKQQIEYVRRLECEHEALQSALLTVTSHMARLQFRIRQIIIAASGDPSNLIADLERIVFKEFYTLSQCKEELPLVERHHQEMGDIKDRQHALIKSLRVRIEDFKTASDCLPMQTDLDPQWETYQALACYCPDATEDETDELKFEECPRYSRTKDEVEATKLYMAERKSAGWERSWVDTNSKSSQTDVIFVKNMKTESRI